MDTSHSLELKKIITTAAKRQAAYIHLTVGSNPVFRIDQQLVELKEHQIIDKQFIDEVIKEWVSEPARSDLSKNKEIIFTKEVSKQLRLKISIFQQKGTFAIDIRLIPGAIPALTKLGLPKAALSLADQRSGLVIVSGPFGSGKTTTVAAFVEEINRTRKANIVTVEYPIEYNFMNNQSLIEQREVGRDALSFNQAIEYALQGDIDVLTVGITREKEVYRKVIEFAHSDRLAFLLMDTTTVVHTLETLLLNFQAADRDSIQLLLSECLKAVVVQRLVPKGGGGLALATEFLTVTAAVESLIKEGRIKQIATVLQTSRAEGMQTLDQSLAQLVKSGEVLINNAADYAVDEDSFRSMAQT